jgi:hypothetical protein
MTIAATVLPAWTRPILFMQDNALLNKAGFELIAVDPAKYIAGKTKQEKQERLFRQAFIFFLAFVFAPAHARAFAAGTRKLFGLSPELFNTSFTHLQNSTQFQEYLKVSGITHTHPQSPEALRKKIIQAKTFFLTLDIGLEGLLFASLGWLKNQFGKLLSGTNTFSGEVGIVDDKTLTKIYQKDQEKHKKLEENKKLMISAGMGSLIPGVVLGLLQEALLARNTLGKLLQPCAKWAHFFEHKMLGKWPLLTNAAFLMIALISDAGDILNARSPRERRETAVDHLSLDFIFFGGEHAFMYGFHKLFQRNSAIPAGSHIKEVMAKVPENLKREAGLFASKSFLASYFASAGLIFTSLLFCNHLTRSTVRKEAAEIQAKEAQTHFFKSDSSALAFLPMNISTGRLPVLQTF